MKFIILLIISGLFLNSCNCGADIKLGEFNLTETSTQFVPYSGKEILVFEDDKGVEHILKSKAGIDLMDSKMTVRTICDEGTFSKQYQYYETQREQIVFFDALGNQIFYVDLTTQFEDAGDLDSLAIYDFLMIDSGIDGNFNGRIEIITEERQNQVSSSHRNEFWNQSDFLGDTTIYGREFKGVFMSTTNEGKSIYYCKEKGVIAFRITDEEYWVLKN